MRRQIRNCSTALTLAFAVGLAGSACSSDKNGSDDGAGNGSGNAAAAAGKGSGSGGSSHGSGGNSAQSSGGLGTAGGASSVGAGGFPIGSGAGSSSVIPTNACPGLPFDGTDDGGAGGEAACVGVSTEAESVPVDMFIMMDRSQSMGLTLPNSTLTRWDALKAAVQSFVQAPSAANIGAGVGFFGRTGGADDTLDCEVAYYEKPTVAIAPLATNGAALVTAIEQTPPSGLTPTVPALQGALSYAQTWASAHTGRATIVVLVTDGFPTQCNDPSPDQVAAAAKAGFASGAHIKTYVIGVGDFAEFNLDNYAQAGGTQTAFLTDQSNASATFLQALLNITDSKLACEYAIPKPLDPKMQIDPDKVQVVYTPASGAPLEVPKVSGIDECAASANGGWYYDDPNAPTSISVCPCTCSSFAAGRVDVRVGCSPHISLR